MHKVTLGTRASVLAAELVGEVVNHELFVSKDTSGSRFEVGEELELHGLVEYPELNGERVTVTNHRRAPDGSRGYYIRSDSGRVEQWLNFVWEKRLCRPA